MDKVADWRGVTKSHEFHVTVCRDAQTGEFVANTDLSSPASVPNLRRDPGKAPARRDFDQLEELRHENLDGLRDLTKQRISGRCGDILQFVER